MADEIRGLHIKFDADFSEFKKSMKSADKEINSTQKQLKTLKDSLKLEWDPKKFQQAQAQAQKALEATEKKSSLLRQRLASIEKEGVTDKTRAEYLYLSEQLEKTDLDALKLKNQLNDLNDLKLKNLTTGLDDVGEKLDKASQKTKALSVAAAGVAAGLATTGLNAVEYADEIATLATKYDMSTEAIQRFNYVALQTDTQAEDLYKAFVKIQGGVADLQTGVESVSTKALSQLGLSFDKFSGKEDQFYAIIDALANMEDQAKMVSLANDIFGEKMATNLFPLIYAGTDALNKYTQEFDRMGALTEDQIDDLAEFDNVLNELKTQYGNVALQLGSSLLPVMEAVSKTLSEDILPVVKDLVDWFANLDTGTKNFILTGLMLLAVLSPALKLMSDLVPAISNLVKWLKTLDTNTLKTFASWALLVAAVGALFVLLANWSKMNPVQKIVGLLGALTAVALAAGIAMGVFQSALSWGAAAAGIVAGIAAVTAAVSAAGKEAKIGSEGLSNSSQYSASSYTVPDFTVPKSSTQSSSVTNNSSSYVDNSNVVINIEKNDYMSEEDIIRAVNKGMKQIKQSRT